MRQLLEILINVDSPDLEALLDEASVHRGTRSRCWVAAFHGEDGRRKWRSTGVRDKSTALAMAKAWEEAARRKRAAQGAVPRKPTMPFGLPSLLTQKEVGLLMGLSDRTIRQIEKEAIAKVRRALLFFWREYTEGDIEEAHIRNDWALSRAEVAALYGLTRTSAERQALTKLLNLMASHAA